ncbi:MAG: hypothetical protein U1E38_08445 [Rhodospirillales bacterium]
MTNYHSKWVRLLKDLIIAAWWLVFIQSTQYQAQVVGVVGYRRRCRIVREIIKFTTLSEGA